MDHLTQLLVELEEDKVKDVVEQEIKNDTDPLLIIEACQRGMTEIGNRFQKEVYFLPELLVASDIFNGVMVLLKDKITSGDFKKKATIVLGTVKGDLHDIGKNIFKTLAEANGFKVCDLGVDVQARTFVEAIKNENAQILGLSGLLTTAFSSMEEVVNHIGEAGLRDRIKIIIGGAPVDENIMKMVGSDAFTRNASEGIATCKSWVGI